MDCKMFSSMIDDYLDDALPEEQRALFLAHEEECKICQSKLEHAQNMLEALQGRAADVPDFVTPAIGKIRRRSGVRKKRIAAFAGIAAALLISSIWRWRRMNVQAGIPARIALCQPSSRKKMNK